MLVRGGLGGRGGFRLNCSVCGFVWVVVVFFFPPHFV